MGIIAWIVLGLIAGAIAFFRALVPSLAVAQEIHAHQRFGSHALAETGELMRADPVRFLTAPNVIAHPWSIGSGANPFSQFIVTTEETAEANGAGRDALDSACWS